MYGIASWSYVQNITEQKKGIKPPQSLIKFKLKCASLAVDERYATRDEKSMQKTSAFTICSCSS